MSRTARLLNAARYEIGRRVFYFGFRMQPVRIRRAISFMLTMGHEWGDKNEADMTKIMNGEPLEERVIAFLLSSKGEPS